jgi:hypothetical protein
MNPSFIRSVVSATFLLVVLLGARVEAQATVRRVPADYPTIQQAIDASVSGDTVLVSPGLYTENINFVGKAIAVTSEGGPDVTIIDGNRVDSVVRFISGEGLTSVLSGFTLQNGIVNSFFSGDGGGITIKDASPTVTNNVITNNSGGNEGGGISIQSGSPTISRNTIQNNTACAQGSGIVVRFGAPLIQGNIVAFNSQSSGCGGGSGGGGIQVTSAISGSSFTQILDNIISNNVHTHGGGIGLNGSGAITIRGNIISGNRASSQGGGISMFNVSPAFIVQNLIISNRADGEGGGIFWSNPPALLANNTIADNDSSRGSGILAFTVFPDAKLVNNIVVAKEGQTAIFCESFSVTEPSAFRFNNVFSLQGTAWGGACSDQTGINGNISADPLFVNPSTGDYHLRRGSPVIDAGDNSAPNLPSTDLDGKPRIQDGNGDGIAVVDMGGYEASPPFNFCIQDDSNGNILRINSTTGGYEFTNCSGFTLSGTGVLTRRGSTITLQQYAGDRRLLARIDGGVNRATAYIQAQGMTFSITDRNIADDTCACAAH